MRITFILPPDSLSGGMRVIATYARLLAKRGHRVVAVQPRHRASTLRETLRSLLREQSWPRNQDREPSHFDGLAIGLGKGSFERIKVSHAGPVREADVPDADVVVATWWETAEWVAGYSPAKGAKAYFVQHHEVHMYGQPEDRVNATWRLPLRKIVVAPWLATLAREQFGDETAIVVPNAVDTALFFTPSHSPTAPARMKQRTPTVGFMHSCVPFKGTDIAVEAVRLARKECADMEVICFGSDPPPKTGAYALPAAARFSLRPRQELIRELYADCDAWLFSSRVEGFGLPILEAMACGTPVIGTPAGAAPELLIQGGGILVPMEDSAAMARAIVQVCRMLEADWQDMSAAAHRTATGYSWDDATDRMEAALKEIVGRISPATSTHLPAGQSEHQTMQTQARGAA